jgi:hypothetical protein
VQFTLKIDGHRGEIIMNRILKSSIASAFAVSLLASTAFAQSQPGKGMNDNAPDMQEKQEMLDQGTTGSVAGGMLSGSDMGSWSDGKITVVPVGTLDDTDPNKQVLQERMKTNPDEVAALQSTIQANPALKAQLESQNVQLNNIVAAEKAGDGDFTFYVK